MLSFSSPQILDGFFSWRNEEQFFVSLIKDYVSYVLRCYLKETCSVAPEIIILLPQQKKKKKKKWVGCSEN